MKNIEKIVKPRTKIAPITLGEINTLKEILSVLVERPSISDYFYHFGRRIGEIVIHELTDSHVYPEELFSIIIPNVNLQLNEFVVDRRYVYNFWINNNYDLDIFPLCGIVRGILTSYLLMIRRKIFSAYECVVIQHDYHCCYTLNSSHLDGGETD